MGPQGTFGLRKCVLHSLPILTLQFYIFHHIPNPLTLLMSFHRRFFKSFKTLLLLIKIKLFHRLHKEYLSTLRRFSFLLPLRESSRSVRFLLSSFFFFFPNLSLSKQNT